MKIFYSRKSAAQALGVSVRTLDRKAQDNRISAAWIQNQIKIYTVDQVNKLRQLIAR